MLPLFLLLLLFRDLRWMGYFEPLLLVLVALFGHLQWHKWLLLIHWLTFWKLLWVLSAISAQEFVTGVCFLLLLSSQGALDTMVVVLI